MSDKEQQTSTAAFSRVLCLSPPNCMLARPYLTHCWPKNGLMWAGRGAAACTDCVELLSASVAMTQRADELISLELSSLLFRKNNVKLKATEQMQLKLQQHKHFSTIKHSDNNYYNYIYVERERELVK